MSKLFQALLSGIFFTFIVDFFLFLGIKENYIAKYNISVYYNILFVDHQNLSLFTLLSLILGFVIIYLPNKFSLPVMISLFVLTFATFIPSIGEWAGQKILMQKNKTIQTDRFSYHGDILYNGRHKITLYDYELKKVIILQKNKIQKVK